MATQGLISITHANRVVFKIVAGCNGMKAAELAAAIKQTPPKTVAEIFELAGKAGFGCEDCLVVCDPQRPHMASGDSHYDEYHRLYRETFEDPRFNPRWEHGTAAYTEVIEQ